MKPKTIILLVVAVGCGLGASIMTSRLLADRRKGEEPEAMVTVVVSKVKVTGWTALKEPEKEFEVREVPEAFAHKRGIATLAELKDQKLNKTIPDGHVMLRDDLLTKEQANIVEQLLPGQRAVAVRVNAESVGGGFVLPSSRVDVMCTMTGNESSAKLVLQNMLVMAVDDKSEKNPDQKAVVPATVTLAATPEEAGRLALAARLGELRLLPRSPIDSSRISQFEVKPEDLKRQARDSSSKGNPDDLAKIDPVPAPVAPLPVLPPVEEKKPEPKLVDAPKEAPRTVAQAEPRKPTKHTMRIIQNTTTVKAVFNLDEKREEDEEEGIVTKPEPKPEPKPVVKTEPKPQPKPAAPAKTTRVGRTRVGS